MRKGADSARRRSVLIRSRSRIDHYGAIWAACGGLNGRGPTRDGRRRARSVALDGRMGAGYCLATERFDVFFSYHSADRASVERIARALQGLGVRPWLDA